MIRIITLINGEQLIGEIDDLSESYKIYNPFYIIDAVNEAGMIGSKLTNVLTFSATDYIVVNKEKIVFDFPPSAIMIKYYEKLVNWFDQNSADSIIEQALYEMEESERRYEKLVNMIKPTKSQLN